MVEPRVAWAGVVIRLSDETAHALEFTGSFTTADVKLPAAALGETSSVWLQGRARYWVEGERFVRKDETGRALEGAPRAIESEVM